VAISAKVVADMISAVGVNRVLTVDLHAEQIQGFFSIPVDNVYGSPVLTEDIVRQNYKNLTVVSPDIGGVVRARAIAKQLNVDLAIIDKRRPQANEAQVMHIIGEVKDRTCLIVDDMVDTAGTLTQAVDSLYKNGAKRVFAVATHPVLSGPAVSRLVESPIEKLWVTDTIPLSEAAKASGKIEVISVAHLLAEAIKRIHGNDSVSSLFE
jgi:ribose-phosphate pyrophosphokinase